MREATLGRRTFLKTAALSMAGLAGAAGLSDCGSPASKPHHPQTVRPATAAEWTAYADSLTGQVIRPSDPAYATGRLLYNPRFDNLYPAAIAYCATPDDVARSISFARDHEIPIAPRAGGHSYGGYSSGTGRLVVDVTPMRAVTPVASGAAAGSASVQAGARLIDVYNALGNEGRLLPGGSCPSVGIAGLALGGGVGVFARQFGITADNVESLTLVTADARTLSCSPESNADLYWACRGGGGGNFGIVTDFTFKTYPLPEVTLFTYDFPWTAAAAVLGSWQEWNVGLDPAVWSNCQLLSGDGTTVRVAGVACASSSQAAAWIQPLLASIGTAPADAFVGGESYINAMMVEAGCSALTVAACHLETATPSGTLSRQAFRASSNYVAAPMGAAALQGVVDSVDAFAASAPTLGGGMVFDALGGAVNDVAPDATAFVHRSFLASIQSSYNWTTAATPAELAAGDQWLAQVRRDVYRPSSGAYQNYIDPTLPDWATAYYGSNLGRLESVKASVDPDGVFTFAQSIQPAR